MIKLKDYLKKFWAQVVLITFFTTEAIHKIFLEVFYLKISLVQITKFSIILVFIFLIYLKSKKQILHLLLLLAFFLIGQFYISNGFRLEVLQSLGRFFLVIILLIFASLYPLSPKAKNQLFVTFKNIMLVNACLIFIAFAFQFNFLATYDISFRFGYNGLFVSSATSSYAFLTFFILCYFRHTNQLSLKKDWSTILIIFSSLFVGTKAIYLGLVLISCLAFFKTNKLSIRAKGFSLLTVFVFGLFIFYITFIKIGDFNEIKEASGLLSAILSFRNDLLINVTLPYINENWTVWNYLFGGTSNFDTRTQLGFLDVFYFWGVIGGICYFYIFQQNFFRFRNTTETLILLSIISLIVFMGGNFFESATAAIYILILREIFLSQQTKS
ncbi:hypothetical protein GCM10010832_12390 [Psychroflexus planctonicus]|uniref:Uncharacterized protein n=1 Tax=Psychroflexus planctonicus TaxID=1526575 RepID=A0ABQ1SHQ2_9FLAO|nr:hypothetical protein GCM10010832_12390 [Psychroflexus planctonicus]